MQHGLLRECIEQLKAAESSRTALVSHLREALDEQVSKLIASIFFKTCASLHVATPHFEL